MGSSTESFKNIGSLKKETISCPNKWVTVLMNESLNHSFNGSFYESSPETKESLNHSFSRFVQKRGFLQKWKRLSLWVTESFILSICSKTKQWMKVSFVCCSGSTATLFFSLLLFLFEYAYINVYFMISFECGRWTLLHVTEAFYIWNTSAKYMSKKSHIDF